MHTVTSLNKLGNKINYPLELSRFKQFRIFLKPSNVVLDKKFLQQDNV